MTIDREQLIELLVSKTGLGEKQVKEQLNQLITQIQKAADQGKSFEVEGLGTFKEEGDTLDFKPEDTLQTEINHKYAGMKPIELIGAYKETSGTEVGKDENISEPVEAEPEPVPEEMKADEAKTTKFQLDEDALAEEAAEKETDQQTDTEELKKDKEEAIPPKQQPPALPEKRSPVTASEESDDPLGKFLVAAVIVIAVGVSGWMIVDFGVFDGLFSSPETTTASTVERADENEVQDNENDLQNLAEQNAGDDVSTNESVNESESSDSPVFGLQGEEISEAPEGYTIVVHSLRSEQKIKGMEQNYRSDGYITIVREAAVGGQTYWRLGLGQFRTVEEAQQAIEELPEPEKSNNFIRKFQ